MKILKMCRWGFFSGGATAAYILLITEPRFGWSHNWILIGWAIFCCIGFGLSYIKVSKC